VGAANETSTEANRVGKRAREKQSCCSIPTKINGLWTANLRPAKLPLLSSSSWWGFPNSPLTGIYQITCLNSQRSGIQDTDFRTATTKK